MAEDLVAGQGNKAERYETLLPQVAALVAGETDAVANMANVAAALKQTFGFFWVGFYVVKGEELVLAPSRGLSPARASATGRAYAAGHGKRRVRWLLRMWNCFPDILPAMPLRGRRLLSRSFKRAT